MQTIGRQSRFSYDWWRRTEEGPARLVEGHHHHIDRLVEELEELEQSDQQRATNR